MASEIGRDLFGRDHRLVALDHRALAVDEELGEVPRDVFLAALARRCGLEKRVQIGGCLLYTSDAADE